LAILIMEISDYGSRQTLIDGRWNLDYIAALRVIESDIVVVINERNGQYNVIVTIRNILSLRKIKPKFHYADLPETSPPREVSENSA